jgi:hypothetical protein
MFTGKLLIMMRYIGNRCYILIAAILAWISLFAISCGNIKTNNLVVNNTDLNTILPSISQNTSHPTKTNGTDSNDTIPIQTTAPFVSPSIQVKETNIPIINKDDNIVLNIKANSFIFYIKGNKQESNHYLKYTLKHITSLKKNGNNVNVWRLYEVFDVQKIGENRFSNPVGPIINAGEWECAIAENGVSYIGGYHGNEIAKKTLLFIDNKQYNMKKIGLLKCKTIQFEQLSELISRVTKKPIAKRTEIIILLQII